MRKLDYTQNPIETTIIRQDDNEIICRIYHKGYNNSNLTSEQAKGYAKLFCMSIEMLDIFNETIEKLTIIK